jgi:hypothetical protein
MSDQFRIALRAGIDRLFEHRRALMRAQTLLRVWPDGLCFECIIPAREGENHRALDDARGTEKVPWDQIDTFDAAAARAVADRVCAKAHALLGTKPPEAAP